VALPGWGGGGGWGGARAPPPRPGSGACAPPPPPAPHMEEMPLLKQLAMGTSMRVVLPGGGGARRSRQRGKTRRRLRAGRGPAAHALVHPRRPQRISRHRPGGARAGGRHATRPAASGEREAAIGRRRPPSAPLRHPQSTQQPPLFPPAPMTSAAVAVWRASGLSVAPPARMTPTTSPGVGEGWLRARLGGSSGTSKRPAAGQPRPFPRAPRLGAPGRRRRLRAAHAGRRRGAEGGGGGAGARGRPRAARGFGRHARGAPGGRGAAGPGAQSARRGGVHGAGGGGRRE